MAGNLVELTDTNFEAEVLNSDLPVLVDFWAPWCGPCRMVGPSVEALAGEWVGKVKVGKLNVDESGLTAGKYGVRSIPTLMIFKQGKMVAQRSGSLPKSLFKEWVASVA